MTKFKLTEIEKIPGDWEVVRLGDNKIFQIRYGKAKPKEKGRIPVVGSSGIYDYTNKALVNPPVIVVGRKGTAGEVFLLKEPCWPSDTTFYITLISKVLDADYLYFFLKWRRMSGEGAKTTLPSLRYDDLSNQHVPLPPFPEQQKIAIILSTVDEATQKTDDIIAKSQELKKGLMQSLLTKGIGHTKFKQTEVGEIPEEWKVVRLGDVCSVRKNKSSPTGDTIATIPMELIPEDGLYAGHIMKKKSAVKSGVFCKSGDLLLAKITPCFENGKQGIVPKVPNEIAIATTEVYPIVCDETDTLYLFYLLKRTSVRNILASRMTGTTGRQRIPKTVLNNLLIPFPSFSEQQKIASILLTIDEKIGKEKQRKEQLEKLKKGLMQDLLRGRVRVKT